MGLLDTIKSWFPSHDHGASLKICANTSPQLSSETTTSSATSGEVEGVAGLNHDLIVSNNPI